MKSKSEKQIIAKETAEIKDEFRVNRNGKLLCTAPTFEETHDALYNAQNSEEAVNTITFTLVGWIFDGVVAFNKAMERTFGFVKAEGERSFFGKQPPRRITIETSYGVKEQFAFGKLKPPSWQGGWVDMGVMPDSPLALHISATIKQKFEPSIRKVVALAQKILREESIYKGSALKLDLKYIEDVENGDGFNPEKCAPEFIDLSKPINLILPREVERIIENNIWGIIRQPGDYRANGVPMKRGFIFVGEHGVGKSHTAAKTARIAAEAGWTFFILKTPEQFEHAYRLSELHPPCVLFIEDVDEIFGGTRDSRMNRFLEILDGVSSKHNEIMTIFTTNYPDRIHEGFMRRSGRIDKIIKLTAFDGESASRFVLQYAGDLLHPDVDMVTVGHAFAGLVGADIVNGIVSAKQDAIRANGRDIRGKIVTQYLLDAAGEIQAAVAEAKGKGKSRAEIELSKVREAHTIVANGESEF